ncbi:hypothetical protein [Actinomadura rudentiformis]|uniref:Uncharacterized protein n=1 Tax=Actinomadura rudentiformis TaxID=359158 RepID=A0A6H9YQ21_9ACTN|nr:hypothetical protein [Actinomadura rudentiformis]KAB2341288.1 hypothetical protein F8566_41955 [Actinomadura rudentiformis]
MHTAPDGKTYVEVKTRLWVEGFREVATEPIVVGAQTIQAIATPKSVSWQLGETTLTCLGPGSKNDDSCSHVYKRSSAGQPGGVYQLSATITWSVRWTCAGADCDAPGGDLADLSMPSIPEPFVVDEIQTKSRQ